MFEKLTENERIKLEEELSEKVVKSLRKRKVQEGIYIYEITIQDQHFEEYLTDKEVSESIKLTIDVMEALKDVNNHGVDSEEIKKLEDEEGKWKGEIAKDVEETYRIWNVIGNENLKNLIQKIDKVQRVGGAWALFCANPRLISAIVAVYCFHVDNFNDFDLYKEGAYFLLRAIVTMRGFER